jgi:hypothetical protein
MIAAAVLLDNVDIDPSILKYRLGLQAVLCC